MTVKTLIIGNGTCALQTAHQLATDDIEVILACQEDELVGTENLKEAVSTNALVETLKGVRLEAFSGFIGWFETVFQNGAKIYNRTASSIVIAEEGHRVPNLNLYGLSSSETVMSVSQFRERLESSAGKLADQKIAFINGLSEENSAVAAAEMIQCALLLQSVSGTQGYYLTANLKVAGNGLEKRYRDAKAAGCLFFKFSDTRPVFNKEQKKGNSIDFVDEVNGDHYSLTPDRVVVDETAAPSDYLGHLARLMQLDTDPAGYIQTDNVHRLTVSTNRRGIYAAGPARTEMMPFDIANDATNAVSEISALRNEGVDIPPYRAEIDTGLCIACLTCFRLCPYKAVLKGHRMNVITDACEGCGICAAECPRGAIAMDELGIEVDHQIRTLAAERKQSGTPSIMLFCCSRSAHRAGGLAACLGYQLPDGLTAVVVPCAGGISTRHMLAAYSGGADGVLVLSCHDGNCHSENGNTYARQRVETLSHRLQQMGISPARLEIHTLASNMAREFTDIAWQFEGKLKELTE